MYAAFPPHGVWILAPASLGVLYACLTGDLRVRAGALIGLVFGLAFFLPLLPWIGVYVGALPWIALAAVMALYLALFGAVATLTMRLPAAPLWFAICWVAVEWLRSSFPFGGFPWGRAAFSQTSGALLPVAAWIGAPGLSFAVALTGVGAALLVRALWRLRDADEERRPAALAIVAAVALTVAPSALAGLALATSPSPDSGDKIEIAAVQGNVPRLGLEFNAQRRAVLDNHVRETMQLAEDVQNHRRPAPELVLWPENASDISPIDNPDAAAVIASAVTAVGVPIVFGTLLDNPDGRYTNSVLGWEADARGYAADQPGPRYDKHIIQPFGEYLPWRSFFEKLSSYASMAGDFEAGKGPAVVDVQTRTRRVVLGVSTCWEVAFDRSPRQAVNDGAQLLFVPTNNATFGRTDMTYQQLAMSQIRAVETGRSVAVVATSGVSALIAPNGRVLTDSEIFTPAVLSASLPLRSGKTPAVRFGAWPERLVVVVALAGCLYALARTTRVRLAPEGRKSSREHDDSE
ncbi:MAG: apolipoprotein N-acyltransferase [Gordonia sp. (in: high G+C Gram-positive bacteria)]